MPDQFSLVNLALGGAIQVFEVATLGQPFEVLKTQMAANRGDGISASVRNVMGRGGVLGFYQGLWPWAIIEASTKGAVLLYTSSIVDQRLKSLGYSPSTSGIISGMSGGIAQAYTTMGFCTFMKTVEITRQKNNQSTFTVAREVFAKEGIRGLNKGVSAVAVRQMTNWGSRFGISRITEKVIRGNSDRKLSTAEKLAASVVGGALACWNQPIEVIRIEMQSQIKHANRPEKLNIWSAAKHIYGNSGLIGFYRGVTPRIGLGIYLTVCMVFGGDQLKAKFAKE